MAAERSTFDWLCEGVSIFALVGSVVLVIVNWPMIPDQIPTHFDASGQPDGSGGKGFLWFLVAMNFGIYLLLTAASRYQRLINLPFRVNRDAPETRQILRSMMNLLKAVLMAMVFYIVRAVVYTALGKTDGLGVQFLPVFLLATLIPMLLFLRKLRKFRMPPS